MQWTEVQGNWEAAKGHVRQYWGKMGDEDVDIVQGSRDRLRGRIQMLYGVDAQEADRQIATWLGCDGLSYR